MVSFSPPPPPPFSCWPPRIMVPPLLSFLLLLFTYLLTGVHLIFFQKSFSFFFLTKLDFNPAQNSEFFSVILQLYLRNSSVAEMEKRLESLRSCNPLLCLHPNICWGVSDKKISLGLVRKDITSPDWKYSNELHEPVSLLHKTSSDNAPQMQNQN